MTDTDQLTYFLSEKKNILVVTFVGPLVRGSAHILEKCIQELSKREATWVILNLRDVPGTVDRSVFPAFARLQKNVRDRKACLRMSALHPSLRLALDEQGLVRADETSDSLAEALSSLAVNISRAA